MNKTGKQGKKSTSVSLELSHKRMSGLKSGGKKTRTVIMQILEARLDQRNQETASHSLKESAGSETK